MDTKRSIIDDTEELRLDSTGSTNTSSTLTTSNSRRQLVDNTFIKSLKRDPSRRTSGDVHSIYYTLRSMDCLARVDDNQILLIAETCMYSCRCANDILYCRGELATHWYILVSGSVFIDGSMFLPICSFGRRLNNQTRRPNECLILEPSEMVCVEYEPIPLNNGGFHHHHLHPTNSRISAYSNYSSDTSSAYSGSDTMGSSVMLDNQSDNDMDLSGLVESTVDSDDDYDDLINSMDSLTVRDAIRECLEKDPTERTEHDINVLLEFTQHLSAFNDLTAAVRRALCQVMVFAVVEKANTTVLNNGEELDSWSVVVNGLVEVEEDGQICLLQQGDSFGLPPTLDKQYFNGEMRTKVDDCQFICVTQADYYRILRQGRENQNKIVKNNLTVLITESKPDIGSGSIVIRGTVDELMNQLVMNENPSLDPTYVEDFLLTHRVFATSINLANNLLNWFSEPGITDRVARVVLLWVNNHFVDFEMSEQLMTFLMRFQQLLEDKKKYQEKANYKSGQLRLLQIACSAKSRVRKIVLSRPCRDDPLPFNIMGGNEIGHGIYINQVDSNYSTSHNGNIRVADELLEVNGQSMNGISLNKAYELLKSSTHLVISVKCNFLGYYECSHTPTIPAESSTNLISHVAQLNKNKPSKKARFIKTLVKIHLLPYKPDQDEEIDSNSVGSDHSSQQPENVLKIYRTDQSFKYLLVNRETTAQEVVMLALQEFIDLNGQNSRDYALFQVSCPTSTHIKQTRLPPALDSLAERLSLGSRYYIKKQDCSIPCLPDDNIPDLLKESEVSVLNVNPTQLAHQLTLEDYVIFRQIESTEYIDDLFGLTSSYGTPNLTLFSHLVNKETFWVVNEILKESNLSRRVSVIKRFIKITNVCKELRNFNSMFSILSGLAHGTVSRLKNTWEKLPNKYLKAFREMQELMNPSRNFGKYRSLLANGQTPMIPFYPIVRKDLTFIDLGNSTMIDNLINFEKMRMLSREIRTLIQMSAAPFDTTSTPILASMNQLKSSSAQLTTTTGKRRKIPLNSKKMYEEMNMIRKVKAYLGKLEIIEDENVLWNMSYGMEPELSSNKKISQDRGVTGNNLPDQNNSGSVRKAPSSPTLSTTSSSDSTKKFYPLSANLAQYQKLMSLSERSRTKKQSVSGTSSGLGVGGSGPNSSNSSVKSEIEMSRSGSSSEGIGGSGTSAFVPLSTESSSVCPGK